MNDASKKAKEKLLAASRDKDTFGRLAVALSLAVFALAIILLVALIDYWIMLPAALRVGALLAIVALTLRGFWQFAQSWRKPTALKEAALDAESQRPDLGCEVSTAAEYLTGERRPVQAYEAELAEALQAKAAKSLERVELPYWRRPLRPAVALGVVLVVFVFFGVLASGALTAFKRAAVPWSGDHYTQVKVTPGNIEIPAGKDLDIKSSFTGRRPAQAKLEWLDQTRAKWETVSLDRTADGDYIYPLKNVRTSFRYRVCGSDATSPDYEVLPYTPPEVKNWQVDLEYPAYTQRPPLNQTTPDISILRASKAHFQITPTVKLAKAQLRLKDAAPIDLKAGADGVWSGDLSINKDTDYWVEIADEKGHTGTNEKPFHIQALPDESPKVEIPEPGADMRADGSTNIPVKISVTDDFGIGEIKLVYHKLGTPEQFTTSARKNETNTEMSAEIPLSSMGLKEYELVAYYAEAKDNNTLDGPGVGKSQVYFVEISNEEGCLCKKPGSPGQKVNLLVIQKQIIADTAALKPKAPADKFKDLALRQKDALDFANIYLEGMQTVGAPPEAIQEIQAAIHDMTEAQATLEKSDRDKSLPPEESALARLYHTLKLVPELKDLPPPKLAEKQDEKPPETPLLKVVLEAIKKQAKDKPDNQEIEKALEEAKQLEQQASLVIGSQNPATGATPGEVKLDRSGKNSKPNSKPGEAKEGQDPKDGQKGQGEGKGKDGKEPKDAPKVAEQEKQLSKEAQALAEKLARMAGKDSRVGHGPAGKMSEAAKKMGQAAEAMQAGDSQTSGTRGIQSDAAMNAAIALLERILQNRPELRDVAHEEFPREYEAEIAEYLKKLSYAE